MPGTITMNATVIKKVGIKMNEVNSLEALLVQKDLQDKGIEHYTMRPGNDCIWVSHGRVDCYYIFHEGRIVDIQVD
jgi:mannose-6-phosphate isomerase-like protein (cupin superfamily)